MQMLDHTAVALYDRLTSDQLRDLLSAYLGAEKSKSLPQKSREQLIASLNSGSDPHLLAILAHRIELVSPYKHCFPYTLDPQQNLDLRKIVEIHKGKLPSLERTFAPLGSGIRSIEPQMYLVDKENERVFLKFAHVVDVWETVTRTEQEQSKKRVPARHVIVAQFQPKLGVVTISFPGFTQALAGADRSAYSNFAKVAATFINDTLGNLCTSSVFTA